MRLLICLSNVELTLFMTEGSQVLERIVLSANFSDADIKQALQQIPAGSGADLIADLLDEDRHTESVARVMPWEQEALLKRMLRRHKGSEALFYTRWTGSSKNGEGRVEKQAHVVSLSDTEGMERLLTLLQQHGINVGSVLSLSELVASACRPPRDRKKKKNAPGQADILLIKTAPGIYRQILVLDGITRLSRQVQLLTDSPDELREEQAGFERFIMVQRLVPFGQTFRYTLIAWDDAQLQRFQDACNLGDDTAVITRTIRTDRIRNPDLLESHPALALILETYARRRPASHFRPAAFLAARKQRNIRLLIQYSARLLVFIALLQGVKLAVDMWNHQQMLVEMKDLERRYVALANQYESRANLPARADDIKDATLFIEAIQQSRDIPGFRVSLINLSQVFAQYPDIRIDELDWERPTLDELNRQQLRVRGRISLAEYQSLKWLTGYLTGVTQAIAALPAVQSAERAELPLEADSKNSLNVSLERGESTQFPIEITIRLDYDKVDD